MIDNKEEALYKEINTKNKNEFRIKLKEIKSITNMNYMFYDAHHYYPYLIF